MTKVDLKTLRNSLETHESRFYSVRLIDYDVSTNAHYFSEVLDTLLAKYKNHKDLYSLQLLIGESMIEIANDRSIEESIGIDILKMAKLHDFFIPKTSTVKFFKPVCA